MIDPVLVHEFLIRTASSYPDKTAIIFNDNRISYKELHETTTKLAYSLKKLGIKKHDRVILH